MNIFYLGLSHNINIAKDTAKTLKSMVFHHGTWEKRMGGQMLDTDMSLTLTCHDFHGNLELWVPDTRYAVLQEKATIPLRSRLFH